MIGFRARKLCVLSFFLMMYGWTCSFVSGEVIVRDEFADGGFDDGADPLDLDWVEHGHSAVELFIVDDTVGIGNGDALELVRDRNAVQGARAVLPEVLTLDGVGDTISLSFDFRFTEPPPDTNRGLRAGLFDTMGTDGNLDDDRGYFMQLGTGFPLDTPGSNNAPHLSVRQELGWASGPANGSDNVGVPNDDMSIFISGVNDELPHHANMTLTKTAAGVLASAEVDADKYTLEFVPDDELWPGKFVEEFGTFDEVVIHGSKGPFDILIDNVIISTGPIAPRLFAGDANMDLQFNQLDLVQVQIAAKYLTGQPATWGEGDWDAAPGGEPGNPPLGNGLFDQIDIIAALAPGHYLTGDYAAVTSRAEGGDGGGPLGPVELVHIPEPSTAALLAIGLLVGTMSFKQRKK